MPILPLSRLWRGLRRESLCTASTAAAAKHVGYVKEAGFPPHLSGNLLFLQEYDRVVKK
jgi:hypothetical protein